MALQDPYAAYNASSNMEAHFVCNQLLEADIAAVVIEDVSQAGVWIGGVISQIHKPQVWIERADIDRAQVVLDDYELRIKSRQASAPSPGTPISVLCDNCGKWSEFPDTQKGLVANCPHCGGYVDVGEGNVMDGWEDAADTPEEEIEDTDAT